MNSLIFDPATQKYVSLATYRRNGIEVKTPVWIAEVARCYYISSARCWQGEENSRDATRANRGMRRSRQY